MIEPFLPMLAVAAAGPFDAPEYLFEVKWDGVRALAAGGAGGWALWGRGLADYRGRYPELGALAGLPDGSVLDGELVLLANGRPDLGALLARHARLPARPVGPRGPQPPVSFMVFDAPYDRGRCLFGRPLEERRRRLARRQVEELGEARVQFSEGVVGTGRAFFEAAVRQGQEGVMAKHRSSPYRPGRRCAAWKKVKPCGVLPCVVVGYQPGRGGVGAVLVAALQEGQLRYAGRLRVGLGDPARRQLAGLLAGRERGRPAVPCPGPAVWVEPAVYCRVRFRGRASDGRLRGARFAGLLGPAGGPTPNG